MRAGAAQGMANYAAFSASFFATSFFSLRAVAESCSSPAFSSQLSRPPLCSTERRPWVDTRSFTPLPSASDSNVTFCRFGRKVRLVLLLAWLTLWPTWRPLPVSSQMRDIVFVLVKKFRVGVRVCPDKRAIQDRSGPGKARAYRLAGDSSSD